MVLLLGAEHPDIGVIAAEARAIFERLGAKPYLERLDAALAAPRTPGSASPPIRSRR